jgi:hypothetical protein
MPISFKEEVRDQFFSIVVTWALVIVAALAWRDVAEEAFKSIYKGDSLRGKFIYALLVTTIVILLAYMLKRILYD